jgi:uncharacterized protein (TIGR03067 family)
MDWGLARDYAARDVHTEETPVTEGEWLVRGHTCKGEGGLIMKSSFGFTFPGALALILLVANLLPADEKKAEGVGLDGTWKLVSLEVSDRDGMVAVKDSSMVEYGNRSLTIKIDTWTEKTDGWPTPLVCKAEMDKGKSPKTLDLKYTKNGKDYVHRCLYVLDGDKLKVLYNNRGSQIRPTSLKEPLTTLYVYERVSK